MQLVQTDRFPVTEVSHNLSGQIVSEFRAEDITREEDGERPSHSLAFEMVTSIFSRGLLLIKTGRDYNSDWDQNGGAKIFISQTLLEKTGNE